MILLVNGEPPGVNALRKEQAGYRNGRGTTDQVFILRNIIEQANEWQATLYLYYIDFKKGFDSIQKKFMGDYGEVWNSQENSENGQSV